MSCLISMRKIRGILIKPFRTAETENNKRIAMHHAEAKHQTRKTSTGHETNQYLNGIFFHYV